MNNYYAALAILTMALVTCALRFLPFVILGKRETPEFLKYLGRVLPYAVMAMLVVYCLKDVNILAESHALPEIISVAVVVVMHVWKRNTLLSIISGTVCYMLLLRI